MTRRNVVEHTGRAIGKARIFINFFEQISTHEYVTLAPFRQISAKREFFFRQN